MSKLTDNIKPRAIIGLGLIVFALMMLFDNMGLHFIGKIFGNWPVGMIIIGGALLYGPFKIHNKSKANSNLPYFLIGFGIFFFLGQHHFFNLNFGSLIGPAILLAIGVHILRPSSKRWKRKININNEVEVNNTENLSANDYSDDDDNSVDVFNILGGSEFSTQSQNLTGGNVICILGGADIDVRDADMNGDVMEINIIALMGGADIKVPPHWQVSVKVIPFLGGVSNKTTCLADKLQVPKKRLIITGLALMGGIEVRN